MIRFDISVCMVALLTIGRPARAESPDLASDEGTAGTYLGELYGVPYRIDVPEGWGGGLLMLAHGYEIPGMRADLDEAERTRRMATFLDRGFAVAQSAYGAQEPRRRTRGRVRGSCSWHRPAAGESWGECFRMI